MDILNIILLKIYKLTGVVELISLAGHVVYTA
jgi:hypothetical protein